MEASACGHENEAEDSGCFTGSFQNSKIAFESTPNNTPTSSVEGSRKRKATLLAPPSLRGVAEGPQFSSTLNESLLLNDLERCRITPNYYVERSQEDEKPVKYVKLDDCRTRKCSERCDCQQPTPATPVKDNKPPSAYYNESPYKEAFEILYPTKPVIPPRKTLTPQKAIGTKRIFSPAKKRLFEPTRVDPMKYFKGNSLVLGRIFAHLSDGDLYRVSMVSKGWNGALFCDRKACARYQGFVETQRVNKENYTITPPDSPPSPDSPPVSPGRQRFHTYTKVAKTLAHGQTLTKCPACTQPSIMEKNIGQCQNPTCGYIHCALCLSFSTTGPQDFHDRCQRSQLVLEKPPKRTSSRFCLGDLSNNNHSDFELDASSIFPEFSSSSAHSSKKTNDTGYASEMDSPLNRVKRNLTRRFSDKTSQNVLTVNNKCDSVKQQQRRNSGKRRRSSLVPVISNDEVNVAEVSEPSSPPKVKNIAGSKQSKRNLKRLLL